MTCRGTNNEYQCAYLREFDDTTPFPAPMRPIAIAPILLLGNVSQAQNLVSNGSFEEYVMCPTGWGQWTQVVDWISPYTTSADYFNACIGNSIAGVPYNQFGYQYAAHGQAYMGLATYQDGTPYYREMIATELNQPLQIGAPICLSFKMAVGGFGSWNGNSAIYTNKGVGMKFFTELPSDWWSYLYPNSAALHLDVVPTDTSAWYTVSGQYVPDSAYTWLVVANFFEDELTEPTLLDKSGFGNFLTAYAFIDDVRASTDLSYCDAGMGLGSALLPVLNATPNPFDEYLDIRIPEGIGHRVEIELLNSLGQCVISLRDQISLTSIRLHIPAVPTGLYLLVANGSDGKVMSQALVHSSP